MRLALSLILSTFSFLGCGRSVDIVNDLPEREASVIVARLYAAGIQSEKVRSSDGVWRVEVAAKDAAAAQSLVINERLLRGIRSSNSEDNSRPFMSQVEQQLARERSVARDVAVLLESIPGVLEAKVKLSLKGNKDLPVFGVVPETQNSNVDGGSGAVLLITRSRSDIDVNAIGALVGSAAGIRPSSVTVLVSEVGPTELASSVSSSDANDRK